MNITVFEFLKRFEIDGKENFVHIYRENSEVKAGTLEEIKAEFGIEPFNPLCNSDIAEFKVIDFRVQKNSIKLLVD